MLLGEQSGFPHSVAAFPPPGCARSPGIDVSPERIGRACPTCHRLARRSGHLTASRPFRPPNLPRFTSVVNGDLPPWASKQPYSTSREEAPSARFPVDIPRAAAASATFGAAL